MVPYLSRALVYSEQNSFSWNRNFIFYTDNHYASYTFIMVSKKCYFMSHKLNINLFFFQSLCNYLVSEHTFYPSKEDSQVKLD